MTNTNIGDEKKNNFKVSPVSRGPMDSATSVPSILSSSSKTTLPLVRPLRHSRHANKKLIDALKNNTQEKKQVPGLPQEGGGQCSHELVKYSHSCQRFLMEALKSLGKA